MITLLKADSSPSPSLFNGSSVIQIRNDSSSSYVKDTLTFKRGDIRLKYN